MSLATIDLKVNSVLVTVTLAFHVWLTQIIAPKLINAPFGFPMLAPLLASLGFYVLAFTGLFWVYRTFFRNRLYPSAAIEGEWFYSMKILGKETAQSFGICQFFRVDDQLCFQGVHFSPHGTESMSRVGSDQVFLRHGAFSLLYESSGTDSDGVFLRKGVMHLAVSGTPPDTLSGAWQDILPAINSGDIILRRRSEETDAILESIQYPLPLATRK